MADAPQIKFDKAEFDKLIKFIDETEQELNTKFLKASSTLSLDDALGSWIKPGSPQWAPVKTLVDKANAFGGSVQEKFTALSDELEDYRQNLIDARNFFEKTNDLASAEAQQFLEEYPGLLQSDSPGGL